MYELLMKRGFQPEEIIVYSIFNRKLEKRLLSEDEAIKIVREELKVIFNDDEIRRIINQLKKRGLLYEKDGKLGLRAKTRTLGTERKTIPSVNELAGEEPVMRMRMLEVSRAVDKEEGDIFESVVGKLREKILNDRVSPKDMIELLKVLRPYVKERITFFITRDELKVIGIWWLGLFSMIFVQFLGYVVSNLSFLRNVDIVSLMTYYTLLLITLLGSSMISKLIR